MGLRKELRAVLQALRGGWDIPASELEAARELAHQVLAGSESTDRQRKTAQLVLDAMEVKSGPSEADKSATRFIDKVSDTRATGG